MKNTVSVLHVKGMDCPTCAALIERTVAEISGVQKAEVNFGAEKMTIVHDTAQAPLQKIVQELNRIGHPATIEKAGKIETGTAWWQQPQTILLLIASVITGLTLTAELINLELPEVWVKVLYGFAAFTGAIYPAKSGWRALRQGSLTINALLVVGAIGAIYLDLWEEAAGLVVIFSLGEVLEAYAMDKARGSIRALVALSPKEATILRDGQELRVSTKDIQIDDIVLVRPGEKIPVDGVVIKGVSAVDQSPITGESIPVEKLLGTEVYASTLNGRGALEIRVTKPTEDTTLAKIIRLVEDAQMKKGAAQRFSERFGQIYTPFMFALALILATVPTFVFGQPFAPWLYRALVVLVVSCSCSLVLSVPVAIVAGVGNAARSP